MHNCQSEHCPQTEEKEGEKKDRREGGKERSNREENNSRSSNRVALAPQGRRREEERKAGEKVKGGTVRKNEHLSNTINSWNKYLINAFFVPRTEAPMMNKTENVSALLPFPF